ncbi:hypothetical protein Q8A73_010631 [Channa argus]|nr:hypothetical protein Q8A73_010631 [Channa argus]
MFEGNNETKGIPQHLRERKEWAALQVLLSLGCDHSRLTAVTHIDKAVRGEVAPHMVMDADPGGRGERERGPLVSSSSLLSPTLTPALVSGGRRQCRSLPVLLSPVLTQAKIFRTKADDGSILRSVLVNEVHDPDFLHRQTLTSFPHGRGGEAGTQMESTLSRRYPTKVAQSYLTILHLLDQTNSSR